MCYSALHDCINDVKSQLLYQNKTRCSSSNEYSRAKRILFRLQSRNNVIKIILIFRYENKINMSIWWLAIAGQLISGVMKIDLVGIRFSPELEVGVDHPVGETFTANTDTLKHTVTGQLVHHKVRVDETWRTKSRRFTTVMEKIRKGDNDKIVISSNGKIEDGYSNNNNGPQ